MIWFLIITTGALVLAAVAEYLIALHDASYVGAVPIRVRSKEGRLR